LGLSKFHSFAPLVTTFARDQWKKTPDGIYTDVRLAAEVPHNGATFKIRVSAHPGIADDVLRKTLPLIVNAGCHFKVISNSALLEFVCSKAQATGTDADFLIAFPRSQTIFSELIAKIQQAVDGFKNDGPSLPLPEDSHRRAPSADNPWPGLDHFASADSPYFFGRKEEAQDLAHKIKQGIVTVVSGQPGVGKTSLICAGLKSHFDAMRYEPIYVRLRFACDVHPVQQIRDEVNSALSERQIDGAPFVEGKTLWDYFQLRKSAWVAADKKPVVPVLVFDQFEDVFAFHGANLVVREEVEAFWTQLSALAENRIPATINQFDLPFPDLRRERELFKIVISLRQNNLEKLLPRRGQMPSITQNQFQLQPMNGRKGLEVVLGAGRRLLDPTAADGLADQIVRLVARETAQSPSDGSFETLERLRVEPGLLSFFCEQLNEARKRARELNPEATTITSALVLGAAEGVVDEFFMRTKMPRAPGSGARKPVTEQKARGEIEKDKPEVHSLHRRQITPPLTPLLAPPVGIVRDRAKTLMFGLALLAIVLMPVIAVIYFEELQRGQMERELNAYVSHLAAGESTIQTASQKLTLAQENVALEKSNLMQLAAVARAREQEVEDAMAQNLVLVGEKTNIQSRVIELDTENAQAESRLAEFRSFLVDLTNQVIMLNRQNRELQARNMALAFSNAALAVSHAVLVVSNDTAVGNLSRALAPGSNHADQPAETAMASLQSITPVAADEDEGSEPGITSVLLVHGDCQYSLDGVGFHPLKPGHSLSEGATIRTGRKSWGDLFVRQGGTTVRVTPQTEVKIAQLAETSRNGVPVTDAVLELNGGSLLTVVRALTPGSSLAVRDSTGQCLIESGGLGSYLITAAGADATDKLRVTPLRLVTQKGRAVIAAGKEYDAKDGEIVSLIPSANEAALVQLDDLEIETDNAIASQDSPGATTKN